MEQLTFIDAAADLSAQYAWVGDVLAFIQRPDVIALGAVVCITASWRCTRNPGRTLACVALTAIAFALHASAYLLVDPCAPTILLPAVLVASTQALYWGATRGDRLQWLWEVVPAAGSRNLVGGASAATVGLLILCVTAALAIANQNPDAMSPMFQRTATDRAWALMGIAGLVSAVPMVLVGGYSMLKGFVGVLGAISGERQIQAREARRVADHG